MRHIIRVSYNNISQNFPVLVAIDVCDGGCYARAKGTLLGYSYDERSLLEYFFLSPRRLIRYPLIFLVCTTMCRKKRERRKKKKEACGIRHPLNATLSPYPLPANRYPLRYIYILPLTPQLITESTRKLVGVQSAGLWEELEMNFSCSFLQV